MELVKNTQARSITNQFVNPDFKMESSYTRGSCFRDTMSAGKDDKVTPIIEAILDKQRKSL